MTFRGIGFLGRDLESVIGDIEFHGFTSEESDVGSNFGEAGISVYAPGGFVEAVAAHREGYYDD